MKDNYKYMYLLLKNMDKDKILILIKAIIIIFIAFLLAAIYIHIITQKLTYILLPYMFIFAEISYELSISKFKKNPSKALPISIIIGFFVTYIISVIILLSGQTQTIEDNIHFLFLTLVLLFVKLFFTGRESLFPSKKNK